MPGDERHRRIDVAMGDRDPGIGEAADPGGDAGYDAERDPRFGECQRLLAAATKDAGIAAFEAQHAPALPGQVDEPSRDVRLARRWPAAALPGVVESRAGPGQPQDPAIDQRVVDDAIGMVERV